jgi:hypothetical protein
MKPNDLVNESLTQEGMWDTLKSKFSKNAAPAEPERKEPTLNPSVKSGAIPSTNNMMPSNMGTYPPKTTDTTQAILPPSSATRTEVPAQAMNAIPNTNVQMPSNMDTGVTTKPEKSNQPTYNVPTGSLPAVSTTMPQNMQTTATSTTPAPSTSTQQRTAPTPADLVRSPETEPSTSTQQRTAPTPDQIAAQQASTEPATKAPSKAVKSGNASKSAGGSIFQGIKDLLDPNAKVARGANKVANKVRADNVKSEVQKWQLVTRGMDTNDTENYQAAFSNWAKQQYPDVEPDTLDEISTSIDPKRPGTITSAISSALNTQMASRPTMSKQGLQGKERDERLAKMHKDAEDEAIYQSYKDQLAKKYNPQLDTSKMAKAFMKKGEPVNRMMPPTKTTQEPISVGGDKLDPNNPEDARLLKLIQQKQGKTPVASQTTVGSDELEPQTNSPEEKNIIDNLKTLKGTEAKLMTDLNAVRSAAKQKPAVKGAAMPTNPFQVPGAMTPQNVAYNAPTKQAEPVAEGRNFSAILWQQMRDSK